MRKTLAILFCAVLLVGVGYVYRYSLVELVTGGEAKAFDQAKKLMADGRPESALNWLRPFSREGNESGSKAAQWRDLYIAAAVQAKDGEALLQLYDINPSLFDRNEEAALLLAEQILRQGRTVDYAHLRDIWNDKQTKPEAWFNLAADERIVAGDRTGAIKLLQSKSFDGKADTGRLVRLALLTVKENPRGAWDYLTQAYNKDPNNPEIRSYRGRLLEVVGRLGLALNEYAAAAQLDPKDVVYHDQLAEFYRRYNRYDLAVDVWKSQLQQAGSDTIWLKTWFWTHVVAPLDIDWKTQKIPQGSLEPFLRYLTDLKPGTFWDSAAFEKLPNAQSYLQTQQVTFWLRLLDALQRHKEDQAWELLQYNIFASQSWNAPLENLLRRVLTYRKIGTFSIDIPAAESPSEEGPSQQRKTEVSQRHPLFLEVNALSVKGADVLKISSELREVLTSPFGIPSCFLVAGWFSAALDLTEQPIAIPTGMPVWLSFDYAQAIRTVQGVKPALAFAEKQPPTPALSLMIGELMIADGQADAGAERLRQLLSSDDEIGYQAAWLLSLLYIERKQYDQARAVIAAQPRLSKETLGIETLARVALLEGNTAEADERYQSIQDKSWEAKSYLARKAFLDKDYASAKRLTEELLRQFPNNTTLRQNYLRIQIALKDQSATQANPATESPPSQQLPLKNIREPQNGAAGDSPGEGSPVRGNAPLGKEFQRELLPPSKDSTSTSQTPTPIKSSNE